MTDFLIPLHQSSPGVFEWNEYSLILTISSDHRGLHNQDIVSRLGSQRAKSQGKMHGYGEDFDKLQFIPKLLSIIAIVAS